MSRYNRQKSQTALYSTAVMGLGLAAVIAIFSSTPNHLTALEPASGGFALEKASYESTLSASYTSSGLSNLPFSEPALFRSNKPAGEQAFVSHSLNH